MLIHLVCAARPNFMKIAPLWHRAAGRAMVPYRPGAYRSALRRQYVRCVLPDLRLPDPDHHLGVGSGSHAEQTGGVMIAYERLCDAARPDLDHRRR